MANQVLYYFYAPTWDYPPEGPIKLGNVITSIKSPERPLCIAPQPETSEIYSTEKRQVVFAWSKLKEGRFSILTKFLSFLGVGADVGSSRATQNEKIYSFDRIETTQFFPKQQYLQRCIEAEAVRRYLDKSRYRKPVYVITGLKTVIGAKAKSVTSKSVDGKLGLEIDSTVWSGGLVPLGGGPEIQGSKETKMATAWEESSDFVFAFRVRRVVVEQKTVTVKREDDYRSGAMLGDEVEASHISAFTVKESDDAENEGFSAECLMDGEGLVTCAFATVSTSK